ncbi:hypothetical protein HNE_2370 [Hyphomonas neptunium ATCC 15444]|uniref:DUF2946 domain-containing protein n=2 Tax=Hyphomonas TaxID=85 RepID=Q0BZM8_HYPNA|nr:MULTISPECIES: hypothetical protein [Hyphomonas]ABI76927.1 hypothetical protein HNE_2370 [Hyphomonas neptunium ATCC 15444]KCZ86764.1 hypothetical protein HHI_16976 [Hyphomonas hirschiana VP5]
MRPARLILWLRSLVAAFLVASLVATPALAASERPDAHAEISRIHNEIASADTHQHDDDHCEEAHGCGSCHFHWMGSKTEPYLTAERVAPAEAVLTAEPLIYLAKAGPYRPPRG